MKHGYTYLTPFRGSPPMLISRDFAKSSPQSSSLSLTMWRRNSTTFWASSWTRRITRGAIDPSLPHPPSPPYTTRRSQTMPLAWIDPRPNRFKQKKIADYQLFAAAKYETCDFIRVVVDDTWFHELRETVTFYTAMEPLELLKHL